MIHFAPVLQLNRPVPNEIPANQGVSEIRHAARHKPTCISCGGLLRWNVQNTPPSIPARTKSAATGTSRVAVQSNRLSRSLSEVALKQP